MLFHILKKGRLIWLILLSSIVARGQENSRIDSLKQVIDALATDSKFEPLVNLFIEYASSNQVPNAFKTLDRMDRLASEIGDSAKIVRAKRIRGQFLNRQDLSKQAIDVLLAIEPIAKRNGYDDERTKILNNLAIAYTVQAEYDKALSINFECLALREEANNRTEISVSLNNIGFVYFKLRNYDRALEYYNKALEMVLKTRGNYELDRLYINIALCHNQLKNFHASQIALENAFLFCGDRCSDAIVMEGEFAYGVADYFLEKSDKAKKHFIRSLSLAEAINNPRFQAENLMYLGHIYVDEGDAESALDVLYRVEEIARRNGYNELLISAYKELAHLAERDKDYEAASRFQGKYIALRDSIFSNQLIDNLTKIQTQYAQRENLATIAAKEDIIRRQRSLNAAIVIIAVLAASLVFVLYRSNRVKKKVNLALSEAKAIIEDQNRQLLSSNYHLNRELHEKNEELQRANESLIRVNEELDNFIYKTSHDIRGPLASLKGMCNVALMDVKDALALDYLHKLDITAEKLNTILTRLLIVNQINNSTLGNERIDFTGIVNDVLTLERKKGLPPRLKIHCDIDENIDFHSDKQFVRIIMENLIDNAIKFYNDSERIEPFVKISVSERNHHVQIKVVDNGIGISQVHPDKIFQMFSRASERSETGGIGLYITKTATEKLGGSVHLATTLEGYTEFFVTLPLVQQRVVA